MGAIDYRALTLKIVELLKAHPALSEQAFSVPVHVTHELDSLTADLTPGVIVALRSIVNTPLQIVAAMSAGQPDEVRLTFAVHCMHFDAQGPGAAALQLDRLLTAVTDALRADVRVGSLYGVDVGWVSGVEFDQPTQNDQGGVYASGRVLFTVLGRA